MSVLVFVRYDKVLKKDLPRAVREDYSTRYTVWTGLQPGQILHNTNECFEFSGYQEGLGCFLRDVSLKLGMSQRHDGRFTLVFLNDTALTGHFPLLVRFLLRISLRLRPTLMPVFTGLVMPVGPEIALISGADGYVSSWFFVVEGTFDELRQLRFYDHDFALETFVKDKQKGLPSAYVQAVDGWLEPHSWLSGWYQAIPGKKTSDSTLQRKRFTIFLEHNLPQRFRSCGFAMMDLSQRLPLFSRVVLRCLRLIDRVYVNLLKLSFRLKYLLLNY